MKYNAIKRFYNFCFELLPQIISRDGDIAMFLLFSSIEKIKDSRLDLDWASLPS